MKSTREVLAKENKWLTDENAKLRNALTKLFKYMDDGVLIRDTSKDHEPDWAIKVLPLMMDLQKAKALINP